MSSGRRRLAREMADCTSAAAASMSRSSSNSMVMEVEPCEELALIVSIPSMVANCLISGVATDFAIVSGEAPDRLAETLMVGNSVRGRAATGRCPKANRPATIRAIDISRVATGRRMQNSEMFMPSVPLRGCRALFDGDGGARRQLMLTVDDHALASLEPAG